MPLASSVRGRGGPQPPPDLDMTRETTGWEIDPGDPRSKVILHVPHASREIPASERRRILLSDTALEAELDAITDAHTDLLAFAAADKAERRPWIFRNRYSRLLVDPERFPDEREEMLEVGMGPVYLQTTDRQSLRSPEPEDDERLMDGYYWPYARAFEDLVEKRLEELGEVLIIDLHSYPREPLPYERHADQARPELCIGVDEFHAPKSSIEASKAAWARSVEMNQPFSGSYVPERFYETDTRVRSVMLEIRRDIMGEWRSEPVETRGHSSIVDLVVATVGTAV